MDTRRRRILTSIDENVTASKATFGKAMKEVKSFGLTLRTDQSKLQVKAAVKPTLPQKCQKVVVPAPEMPKVASLSIYTSSSNSQSFVPVDCFDDEHKYLLYIERCRVLPPLFLENKIISPKMRAILFDWMLQIFQTVNFNMGFAYPINFLKIYLSAVHHDDLMHTTSKLFLDLFMSFYDLAHKLPSVMAQVSLYLSYFVAGTNLPAEIYPLMGIKEIELKKECSDFVDPVITFSTTPKETSLHRKYKRLNIRPQLDSLFSPDWSVRVDNIGASLSDEEKEKRLDEGDEENINLTDEEREKRDFQEEKRKEHIVLFPVMVSFCLEHVQLDNHSDIRSLYLPKLLRTILSTIAKHGCDKFTRDNLVALLSLSRTILSEINQSTVSVETGEQKLIESCFKSCYEMVQCVCEWYISGRDRDKTGVLCAASAFLKDFGDFPIYCYEEKESDELCDHYSSASVQLPKWVIQLLKVSFLKDFG
uniref:Cyclin C-terminal domain-containing protein n=1 Tax=Panagrolaimus davidi TaxID=227884 RepID=A0A914QZL2_9BILA